VYLNVLVLKLISITIFAVFGVAFSLYAVTVLTRVRDCICTCSCAWPYFCTHTYSCARLHFCTRTRSWAQLYLYLLVRATVTVLARMCDCTRSYVQLYSLVYTTVLARVCATVLARVYNCTPSLYATRVFNDLYSSFSVFIVSCVLIVLIYLKYSYH
jgi:hypothetical protein